MRSTIIAALTAAMLLPVAAQAQDSGYRDRQDQRYDQRDDQHRGDGRDYRQGDDRRGDDQRGDDRQGDRRDGRYDDHRNDHRDDHRDARYEAGDRDHAYGRDDWRGWRNQHRDIYAGRGWRAPFGYTAFRAGGRIDQRYYGPQYLINDPWRYHLAPARPGLRYVRHYNDVLLIDVRRGYVVDVIRGFYY